MTGKVIENNPCTYCGSRDNLKTFEDGGVYCMTPACDFNKQKKKHKADFVGEYKELSSRGITKSTCTNNLYQIGKLGTQDVEVANYVNRSGEIVSQKVRFPNKEFAWLNRTKDIMPFGYTISLDYSKPIIVTEGEIDQLSCSELGYQAISLVDGAQSVKRSIELFKNDLIKFKEIIIFFDNDASGKEALKEATKVLPLDKIRVVTDYLGHKDANDLLKAGLLKKVLTHFTSEFTPNGIIFGNQLKIDKLVETRESGLDLPWPKLSRMLRGLRKGKLVLLGGGSNIGKSPILREIGYFLRTQYPDIKIANLFLEEDQNDSPLSYIAMEHKVPLMDFVQEPLKYITQKQFDESYNKLLNTDKIMFSSSQYDLDSNELLNTLEYLTTVKKYDVVMLDHISLIISTSASREGERRDIDVLMNKLRSLIRKTGITVIAACHLSNPDQGKDWEEGREIRQKDFRGSGSLRQIPDILLGVERNMRNDFSREKSVIRVIKNRGYGSDVGIADELHYISTTGRLVTLDTAFGEQNEK